MVELTHQFPVLPVRDVARAQAYYRDVFRFRIDWIEGDRVGHVDESIADYSGFRFTGTCGEAG